MYALGIAALVALLILVIVFVAAYAVYDAWKKDRMTSVYGASFATLPHAPLGVITPALGQGSYGGAPAGPPPNWRTPQYGGSFSHL